jgi:hypothetical protein
MKSLILFCTKLRLFLTELPPLILLLLAIKFNDKQESVIKLYPLIILMGLVIIFIALYLFKIMVITNEQIKMIGLFSSREKVILAKDKTVSITVLKGGRVRIDVLELSSNPPVYAWIKSEGPREIRLFSEKANGGLKVAKRIIKHFGVDAKATELMLKDDEYEFEDNTFKLSVSKNEEGRKEIRLFFKETV